MDNSNFPNWDSNADGISSQAAVITVDNESTNLPNSRQLVAGDNIILDPSIDHELKISAASGTAIIVGTPTVDNIASFASISTIKDSGITTAALNTAITGIIPIERGGTNSNTTLTNNKVMISKGGKIVEGAASPTQLLYVDTINGNNSWIGTFEQPFATIAAAIAAPPNNATKTIYIKPGSVIDEEVTLRYNSITAIIGQSFTINWDGFITIPLGSSLQMYGITGTAYNTPFIENYGTFIYENCNFTTSFDKDCTLTHVQTIYCDEASSCTDLGGNIVECIYQDNGTGTAPISAYCIDIVSVTVLTKIIFNSTSIYKCYGLPYLATSGIILQRAYTPPVNVTITGTGINYLIYDIANSGGMIILFQNDGKSNWNLTNCRGRIETIGTSIITIASHQTADHALSGSFINLETTFDYNGNPPANVVLGYAGTGTTLNIRGNFYTLTDIFPQPGSTSTGTLIYNLINGLGNVLSNSSTNFINAGTTNKISFTAPTLTSARSVTFPDANTITVQPISTAPTNQVVQYIGSNGTQNLTTLSFSNLTGQISQSQQVTATNTNFGSVKLGTDINLNSSSQLQLVGTYNGNNLATTNLLVGQSILSYDPVNNIATDTVALDTALTNLNNAITNAINGIQVSEAIVAAPANIDPNNPGVSIDGVTLNTGDTILLYAQTAQAKNGLWIFNGPTTALTRSPKMSAWSQVTGAQVIVDQGGTVNGGTIWFSTSAATGTISVTPITFTQLPSGVYNPGTNISITSNAINVVPNPSFTTENLSSNTNFLTVGTTNQMTFTMSTLSAARTFTLPDANSNSIQPLSAAVTNQFINYIDSSGVQHTAQPSFSNLSGTSTIGQGGTGQTTAAAAFNALSPLTTLGDTLYGGASGVGTRLAGNITATRQVLTQTGNGTISAAPSWYTLTKADVGLSNVPNTDATNLGNDTIQGTFTPVSSAIISGDTGLAVAQKTQGQINTINTTLQNTPNLLRLEITANTTLTAGQIPNNSILMLHFTGTYTITLPAGLTFNSVYNGNTTTVITGATDQVWVLGRESTTLVDILSAPRAVNTILSYVKVKQSTIQNIAAGYVIVNWNSIVQSIGSTIWSSGNPGNFVIPTAGLYTVDASIRIVAATTQFYHISLWHSSLGILGGCGGSSNSSGADNLWWGSTTVQCAAGDILTCQIFAGVATTTEPQYGQMMMTVTQIR